MLEAIRVFSGPEMESQSLDLRHLTVCCRKHIVKVQDAEILRHEKELISTVLKGSEIESRRIQNIAAPPQFFRLSSRQTMLSTDVRSFAQLRQSYALPLTLADQITFELRERSHDAQEQVRHWRVLSREGEVLLSNRT